MKPPKKNAVKIATKKAPAKKTQAKAAKPPETVLVLRTVDADGKGFGGFPWPDAGPVEAPAEWNSAWGPVPQKWRGGFDPTVECGAGLHGLLWGKGSYSFLNKDALAKWQVVEVLKSEIVDFGEKVKFPRGVVLFTGAAGGALALLRQRNWGIDVCDPSTTGDWAHSSTTGYGAHSSTTGNGAHSSTTGNGAHSSTTGNWAHSSTTGDWAHSSTTGYGAHSSTTGNWAHSSTTGDWAHSSTTGNWAHSSTTGYGAHSSTTGRDAVAAAFGYESKVRATDGPMVIAYKDANGRRRLALGYPGENGIQPGKWYRADRAGNLIETQAG
ncbi:MAG: hypothetical protein QM755_23865 [Luteolibacter sp.]